MTRPETLSSELSRLAAPECPAYSDVRVPPSTSSISDAIDRVVVRATITARTANGMSTGTLLWVQGARLLTQLDAVVEEGAEIDVKVDLSPVPGTALIRAVVGKCLPSTGREMPRYVLLVREVAEDDRGRWTTWLAARLSGGTLSNVSDIRDGTARVAAGAERERRAAVERLDRLSGANRSVPPGGTRSGGPAGPAPGSATADSGRSVTTGSNPLTNSDIHAVGSGRAAMREALKAAIKRTFDDTPLPELQGLRTTPTGSTFVKHVTIPPSERPLMDGTRPAPRTSLPPRPTPGAMPPVSATAPPPGVPRPSVPRTTLPPVRPVNLPTAVPASNATARLPPASPTNFTPDDPKWSASEFRNNHYLDVCWTSADAYTFDVYAQVLACALTLHTHDKPLPDRPPIFVVLRHGTVVVQCEAAVLEHSATQATYRLQLNAGQLAELRRAAKPGSVSTGPPDPHRPKRP